MRESPHDGDLYGALAVPFRKWEALVRFFLEPKLLLDDELLSGDDPEVSGELSDSSISEVELRETIQDESILDERDGHEMAPKLLRMDVSRCSFWR